MKPRVWWSRLFDEWCVYEGRHDGYPRGFSSWSEAIRYALSLTALLLLFALYAAPARAQITLPAAASTFSCPENNAGNVINPGTANATVTVGSTIIVVVNTNPTSTYLTTSSLATLNGNAGNATGSGWKEVTAARGIHTGNSPSQIFYWYNVGNPGTNGVFTTVTAGAGVTFVGGCMFEVDGLTSATDPLDGGNSINYTTTQTQLLTPAWTVAHPNEFLAASSTVDNIPANPQTCANGGFTFSGMSTNGPGGTPAGVLITSASGSYTGCLLQTPNATGMAQIAAFIGLSQPVVIAPRRFIQFGSWLPWPIRWLLDLG